MERVQLYSEFGKQRLRRWGTEEAYGPFSEYVEFGRLADGRWYSDSTRDLGGANVWPADEHGEKAALEHCYQRIRNATVKFIPVPAGYNADGTPADDLPWIKRGNDWVLPEPDRTTDV